VGDIKESGDDNGNICKRESRDYRRDGGRNNEGDGFEHVLTAGREFSRHVVKHDQ
jgi:hypothetical protein